MSTGTIILIIIGSVVLLLAFYTITTYNKLVKLRNMVKDQWAQIDVQLKTRADLIPNLVETIKGYAKHESETLENVVRARNAAVSASSPAEEMKANGELTQALNRLMVVAEAYPELKANSNFMDLQKTLGEVEGKINIARQFYNDTVLKLNNSVEMFPSNIIAGMFNFKIEPFFEATEAEKEVPQVKF